MAGCQEGCGDLHSFVAIYLAKGLERPRLIGLAGAGFKHAWIPTKASASCVEARQDDYIKGIWSPGSSVLNPARIQNSEFS